MEDRQHKVERVGKKYQMIALHELLGYLSDHYQMRSTGSDEEGEAYQGSWQLNCRDFDPTTSPGLAAEAGDEDENEEVVAVWPTAQPFTSPFADPDLVGDRRAWAEAALDEPEKLLVVREPDSAPGADWLVLDGFWKWCEPKLLRLRAGRQDTASMFIHARSWLVPEDRAEELLADLDGVDFWGNGCHGVSLGDGWIGEYPWGRVFDDLRSRCESEDEWINPWREARRTSVPHIRTACDWDRAGGFKVPGPHLYELLRLRWSGDGSAFVGPAGNVIARQVECGDRSDVPPLVVRRDTLAAKLADSGLRLLWGLVGEREAFDYNVSDLGGGIRATLSAVYTLTERGVEGGLTFGPRLQPWVAER